MKTTSAANQTTIDTFDNHFSGAFDTSIHMSKNSKYKGFNIMTGGGHIVGYVNSDGVNVKIEAHYRSMKNLLNRYGYKVKIKGE